MVRIISFTFVTILLLVACSPTATDQPVDSQGKSLVTVYREPT